LLLPEIAKKQGWQVETKQQDVCPVLTLPKTWEEYLKLVGKKQRHEIQRKWKNTTEKLEMNFVCVEKIMSAEQIEKDTSDFIRLHQLSSENKAAFWDEDLIDFFKDLIKVAAENNWLKLFFLEVGGERVAATLCFDYNNVFYLYNSGYDPSRFANFSVGNVLTSFTIKKAIELGRVKYDFLRGEEEYKFRYGAVAEPIFDLTITR
jgi:CelD/BcsL family acetyltransferase involved in cellulose biosynthesis